MGLLIRMVLYLVFGIMAGFGIGTFDGDAGTMTFNVDSLATTIAGIVSFIGTYVVGRWGAKRHGWRT